MCLKCVQNQWILKEYINIRWLSLYLYKNNIDKVFNN